MQKCWVILILSMTALSACSVASVPQTGLALPDSRSQRISAGRAVLEFNKPAPPEIPRWFEKRLQDVIERAPVVQFDTRSRFVILSDCHRGIKDQGDVFVKNEALYLQALEYYLDEGFTYIEAGDGDELWRDYDFYDIQYAYPKVFKLLHAFNASSRLHILLGNHDTPSDPVGNLKGDFGLSEALLLVEKDAGYAVLILHGHQAELFSDRLKPISRLVVNTIWQRLKGIPLAQRLHQAVMQREHVRIQILMANWASRNHTVVISGHTHQLHFPGVLYPATFNGGTCSNAGHIFGLELVDSQITPIVWQEQNTTGGKPEIAKRTLSLTPYDMGAMPTLNR